MLEASAISSRFEVATHMAITDPDNAALKIEELKRQVEPIMQCIDASIAHVAQMPAGKVLEAAVASTVEGLAWGAIRKLCKLTVKTIPVISQAIKDGVAIGEIAITTEGIPVRISAPKVVECMEAVNAGVRRQKLVARVVEINKMRGKQSSSYLSVTSKDMRPLNRLKGKDLIGIEDVSVQGYKPLSKRVVFDNYKHYLQPEIRKNLKGKLEPSGWHHDPGKRIERIKRVNGHKIEIIDKEMHASGIYKFDWGVEGMRKKTSTFFPHAWSREMVQRKITEAYKYARKQCCVPEIQRKDTFVVTGFTTEGINVKIVIDNKGNVITAFPLWTEKRI